MQTHDTLQSIQAIRTTKARFVRGADTQDAALLANVLTDDVVIDFTEGATDPKSGFAISSPATAAPIHGREAAVAQICGTLGEMVSIHHLGEPEIEVSGDTATGVWPVTDRLWLPHAAPLAELVGYGHYHETYRRDGNTWRIASLKLTRLRFYGVPRQAAGS